jgi:hypothetical protein
MGVVKHNATQETTLYIKAEGEPTPEGEVGKNYRLCYSAWEKKETSCKEIRVSITQLKSRTGGFL